jgi:hypothetical protein
MTWRYSQSTGEIFGNGRRLGTGYSGAGKGKNKPNMENIADTGPIPKGIYRIGPPYHNHKTGPHSMNLTPIGHNALGRSGFLVHGDSRKHPGQASSGCIILSPEIRTAISDSRDTILQVVP